MRLISWNCNGALRNKREKLDSLDGDILIIQECENPQTSTHDFKIWAGHHMWTGPTKHKGLGVFSRNGLDLQALNWNRRFTLRENEESAPIVWQTRDLGLFLPFKIGNTIIIAVWTKPHTLDKFSYVGQLWLYLKLHKKDMVGKDVILIGDFNANPIWDRKRRWWNHSDVVRELDDIGIRSLYHTQTGEQAGTETWPTFYLHRHQEKPYHIDYAFLSEALMQKSRFEIGTYPDWINLSDHMPLVVEVG